MDFALQNECMLCNESAIKATKKASALSRYKAQAVFMIHPCSSQANFQIHCLPVPYVENVGGKTGNQEWKRDKRLSGSKPVVL